MVKKLVEPDLLDRPPDLSYTMTAQAVSVLSTSVYSPLRGIRPREIASCTLLRAVTDHLEPSSIAIASGAPFKVLSGQARIVGDANTGGLSPDIADSSSFLNSVP
jgi:hypothetical protein